MSLAGQDLLGGPPPTRLPEEPGAALVAQGADPAEVAAQHPTSSAAWAALAQTALEGGQTIAAYAYARTGYHRGLDALRRAGWKGYGPVPADHAPNQGFLRALAVLGTAAERIGEADEAERIARFLDESDPRAREVLGL